MISNWQFHTPATAWLPSATPVAMGLTDLPGHKSIKNLAEPRPGGRLVFFAKDASLTAGPYLSNCARPKSPGATQLVSAWLIKPKDWIPGNANPKGNDFIQ
jgi:hypothetical protein